MSHDESHATDTPRFLVVEDDPACQRTLVRCLNRYGAVEAASTAAEGRAAMKRPVAWTAITIDEGLPDGSGFELLEELRSLSPDLPVALITAAIEVDLINPSQRLGAVFLGKPFEPNDLDRFIKEAIRRQYQGQRTTESLVEEAAVRWSLSPVQRKVLGLAINGDSREQMAEKLGVTLRTVRYHVEILLKAAEAKSLDQLVIRVLRERITPLPSERQ